MAKMPAQKPGRSKQDYCTPPEFLEALKDRLQIKRFWCDLAATKETAVAEWFYTEENDALQRCWNSEECDFFIPKFSAGEWAFCNPPFGNITPWVQKAMLEAENGAHIAMLVPASVGSNWWADFVHDSAYTLFVRPRLTFVGAKDPYPKDIAVLLYQPICFGGYELWKWK
jgi:phage N-6-adenine-methyltransferase